MDKHILATIDPKLLGGRLQDARKARGLTQDFVAKHLDLSRTTLVAMEKGERRVTPQEVIRLAELYGRAVSDFVGERPSTPSVSPQFRASALTTSSQDSDIESVVSELQQLSEDYLRLETIWNAPLLRLYPPPISLQGAWPEQEADEVAAAERNRLGLGDGPIADLRERLESDVGMRIFFLSMPSKVAGLFFYSDPLGACVGINAAHPRERGNWTLAHEYAHFLTTRYQVEITEFNGISARRNERFADAFAASFLMPAIGLHRRFSELQRAREGPPIVADIIALADTFQVSVQALILRLEDLKRLRVGAWERLRTLKVRDAQRELGIQRRRGEDKLPRRYKLLAVRAFERGELSEGQLASILRCDRVSARLIVDEMTEPEGEEAGFAPISRDLAQTVT